MTTPPQRYGIDFTVPAGTPSSAPVTAVVNVPSGAVTRAKLTVPTGHNGLTGFALLLAGSPIIPYGGDSWVIASGQEFEWEIQREVQQNQLTVQGYNTGIYPHTFHLLCDWVPALGVQGASAVLATASPQASATDQAVGQLQGFVPDDTTDLDADLAALDTSTLAEGEAADTSQAPPEDDTGDTGAVDLTAVDLGAPPVAGAPSETLTPYTPAAAPAPPPARPATKPKTPARPAPRPARRTVPRK